MLTHPVGIPYSKHKCTSIYFSSHHVHILLLKILELNLTVIALPKSPFKCFNKLCERYQFLIQIPPKQISTLNQIKSINREHMFQTSLYNWNTPLILASVLNKSLKWYLRRGAKSIGPSKQSNITSLCTETNTDITLQMKLSYCFPFPSSSKKKILNKVPILAHFCR